jgi:hypothetical protein
MFALGAVVPDRLRVLDADGVDELDARGAKGVVSGHEAREEGVGLVRHDVLDGDTRVVEGGLNDGVVLWDPLVMIQESSEGQEVLPLR